ncbi:hypothetical protein [Parvibaculum sp.]|uniref:hypothetical protein n=1 Tax=Parvibaculum sp. TaxID=2024848 RepID=UPI001D2BEDAF|nr:hypothetical protein [Parvibaculum sp.]MBX3490847.1 hypothetical protein [Parvibaculum sp.]
MSKVDHNTENPRTIEDRAGEAIRRFRHGEIRPLWDDMPDDGIQKQKWRDAGASLIEFMGRVGLEVKVKENEDR